MNCKRPLFRLFFGVFAMSCALFPAVCERAEAAETNNDAVETSDSATPITVTTGYGEEVDRAASVWIAALEDKPRLVSLRADKTTEDATAQLRERLKNLGSKTFSNREWRRYWARQDTTSTQLVEAVTKIGKQSQPTVDALGAWAGLARDKVANQDRYLVAIETERDALEERLEANLEPVNSEKAAPPAATLPNPYERRKMHLDDLRRRTDWQKRKRRLAEMDRNLIERQLQSEAILLAALQTDVELALRERNIAAGQAKRLKDGDFMQSTWAMIAKRAAIKVEALRDEASHGGARKRGREVELGLSKSQLKFRDQRIAALVRQSDEDGGFATWLDATGQTLLDWLIHDAWSILLGLILVFFGMRIALTGVGRGIRAIIIRAEGDPDDPSDDDQRILTLARVFSSVARLAVWVIAALVALETIGVNTGPLLGSVAILGLAISFGSQNLVRDVVNGFFILMENQYAVGEVVDLGGKTGTVEQITIRSTWIRQANGNVHVVPNGAISLVSNLSRDWNRGIVHVGVAYGTDIEKVRKVVNDTGIAMYAEPEWAEKLLEAPTFVGVTELADSSVNVRVWAKCEPGAQWGLERELLNRIHAEFNAADIEIPFPQRVIHNAP